MAEVFTRTGFDSRFWNGSLPEGATWDFVGLKATEGDFRSAEFPVQFRASKALGLPRLAFTFFRARSNQVEAAKVFREHVAGAGDGLEFPPVVDIEDTKAPKTRATAEAAWVLVQEVEQQFGREAVIYTANWYWEAWRLHRWFAPDHPIYDRDLWESDPPPDTVAPGEWRRRIGQPVMVQYVLDWYAEGYYGFNGRPVPIDVNKMREDFFVKYTKKQPETCLTVSVGAAREFLAALKKALT